MRREVVEQPAARRDLRTIAVYLGRKSPQVVDRFFAAVNRTFVQIANRPGIGAPFDSAAPVLTGLRVCSVTRFRSYLIYYRATDEVIDIVRVLHSAQDAARHLSDPTEPG